MSVSALKPRVCCHWGWLARWGYWCIGNSYCCLYNWRSYNPTLPNIGFPRFGSDDETNLNHITRSAIVPYSAQQMFDVINNIAEYPQFMDGCVGSEILERGENWLVARLDMAKAGMKQSLVTRNTLDKPLTISMSLEQGPFKSLSGQWRFEPIDQDGGCKVSFHLDFEFSSKLVAIAAGRLFESIASNQVNCVCLRAKHVYA